jgi:hypothetical protein
MCGLVAAAAVTEILFPARSAFAGHFQKNGEIDLLGKTKGSFRIWSAIVLPATVPRTIQLLMVKFLYLTIRTP